ncbi:hypothetical protein RB195_017910 [Necator americanus]|uniref:Uncharacterized protein n=2 Tax=Necator americanus TaxID=51031 RepID=A0ABR1C9Q2_NECAM|nr:hypothetical protein NECAME_17864 [Necator americanus]ETN81616.1 hypothetical protein NECAME_17864 [Necator americanus]
MSGVRTATPSRRCRREEVEVEEPLYAMGRTQAYLLSLVAPRREIILIKPYNQMVEEKLLADIRRSSKREQKIGPHQKI